MNAHDECLIVHQTAVLKEGLRLSALVTTRLPRAAPDEVLQFHGWEIPRGVRQLSSPLLRSSKG